MEKDIAKSEDILKLKSKLEKWLSLSKASGQSIELEYTNYLVDNDGVPCVIFKYKESESDKWFLGVCNERGVSVSIKEYKKEAETEDAEEFLKAIKSHRVEKDVLKAKDALEQWLSFPNNLGHRPEEIECTNILEEEEGIQNFIFKFKKSRPDKWLLGIVNNQYGQTSAMKEYKKETEIEDAIELSKDLEGYFIMEEMLEAQNTLEEWLSFPNNLGHRPEKIQFTKAFIYKDVILSHIFKYKKSALGKWLLGTVNKFGAISAMKGYKKETEIEDATELLKFLESDYIEKEILEKKNVLEKWLSSQDNLGHRPEQIELTKILEDGSGFQNFIFKYKKLRSDKWLLGIVNKLGPFSTMKEYKKETEIEDAIELLGLLYDNWMEENTLKIDNVLEAKSALKEWLFYPTRLGHVPVEIEFVNFFEDIDGTQCFIFKYKKSMSGKWYLGIVSDSHGPFSEMKEFKKETEMEDAIRTLEHLKNNLTKKDALNEENTLEYRMEEVIVAAKNALEEWLCYPTELGCKPEKIEFTNFFEDKDGTICFIFKYKKSIFSKWCIGIVSNSYGPFSEMKSYKKETEIEDAMKILEFLRSYWQDRYKSAVIRKRPDEKFNGIIETQEKLS